MMKRRDALLSGLFGTGYLGLRALATGLPAWFIANPRRATAQSLQCALANQANLQYLIVSTNFNGDPINCNCPGTYESPTAGGGPPDAGRGGEDDGAARERELRGGAAVGGDDGDELDGREHGAAQGDVAS